jgi:ArsR family transcriptional regulator
MGSETTKNEKLEAREGGRLIRSIDPEILNQTADVIKVLGHPDRLRIVEVLEDGEKSVSEIQEILDLPQAIVSQHLAKMRGWDIVAPRRDGIHVYYRILEPKVEHILHCIRHCDL